MQKNPCSVVTADEVSYGSGTVKDALDETAYLVRSSHTANTTVTYTFPQSDGKPCLLIVTNINRNSSQSAVYILSGNPDPIPLSTSGNIILSAVGVGTVTIQSQVNTTVSIIRFK